MLFSCKSKYNTDCNCDYDIEIVRESDNEDIKVKRSRFKEDVLYITVVGNFNEDSISVYRNNEEFINLTNVVTDESSGISTELQIPFTGMKNLSFRINNGNLVYIDLCNNPPNFMVVSYRNNKVKVVMKDTPTMFD